METKKLNWSKGNGLLPAIIQDFNSKDILMLGFMNEEALERTLSENKVTFFSRTQDKLWRKGDTSGNSLCVKDIAIDCDKDTILVQAVMMVPLVMRVHILALENRCFHYKS